MACGEVATSPPCRVRNWMRSGSLLESGLRAALEGGSRGVFQVASCRPKRGRLQLWIILHLAQ